MKKYLILIPIFFLILSTSCEQYMDDLAVQANLNDGLVAYWPIVENSGTIIKDFSGFNRDIGFSSNATFSSGKFSNALNLTGTDPGTALGANLCESEPVTIALWINAQNNTNKMIFSTQLDAFRLEQVNQSLTFNISTNDFYSGIFSVTNCISYNTWFYFTAVYDGSSVNIYIDGNLKAKTAYTDKMDRCDYIEINNDGWIGLLDEIRIYNRALSQKEIKALMEIGRK